MTKTDAVITEIEKQFGEGIIRPASTLRKIEYRSSGSIALDLALGGGWAKCRIIDVVGKPATGKTLLLDLAAIEAWRTEKKPSLIFDFEHAYDAERFIMLGGDPKQMHVVNAETFDGNLFIETCIDMLKLVLPSNKYACIGFDSTAAMVSVDEYEIKQTKGEEASTIAYTARAMSSLLRQVVGTGSLARSGATLFFMSQMRDNIGARAFRGIPPPDKRTGGRALYHYAGVQVEVIRGETIKGNTPQEKQIEHGHETKVRVRKNKCNARQGRVAMFEIYTEGNVRGLDRPAELCRLATTVGVIERRGKWYMLSDDRKAGSFDLAVAELRSDKTLFQSIWDRTVSLVDEEQSVHATPAVEVDEADIISRA